MKVYNTLSRKIEEFTPIDGNKVRIYSCGPTVYDYAHIGNFRAYIFEDILRRYLKYSGFTVEQVMNLTDVDDKTIKGAVEKGVSLNEYTQVYKDAFFKDLKKLNIESMEHYPSATGHIPEMIELIKKLLDKGYAYKSDDGSIYFKISEFKDYGKLAHLDMSGLLSGARVAQDEYDKENAADFALWKACNKETDKFYWDSPWGIGRPGWHIECSAMSMKYLGESFDLHTGGVDNIFPHHEDEIAQSEGATGKPFVRYWMHCAHLVVEGRKMSKSLGNFYTLRHIFERGYSGREIRYVLMSAHYRQGLNFTFNALDSARSSLTRFDDFYRRICDKAEDVDLKDYCEPEWLIKGVNHFVEAMDNDLNMPEALSGLFEIIRLGNKVMDDDLLDNKGASGVLNTLNRLDTVFGLLCNDEDIPCDDVMVLFEKRKAVRTAKNWTESDRLRDELAELGWDVRDTANGMKLIKKKN